MRGRQAQSAYHSSSSGTWEGSSLPMPPKGCDVESSMDIENIPAADIGRTDGRTGRM